MLKLAARIIRQLLGAEFVRLSGLLGLALLLSIMTLREQHDADAGAGRRLVKQALDLSPKRCLIATPVAGMPATSTSTGNAGLPGESSSVQPFVDVMKNALTENGVEVEIASGDAREVRKVLEKLNSRSQQISAILTTHEAARWALFDDLPTDFPQLGKPIILSPEAYRWPDFLKARNLFNIADQIAVIAVVAIGMTLVIITGGIDLSVGSLIALSAVTCCLLIQDYGGGTQAGLGVMWGCAMVGVLAAAVMGAFNGALITGLRMPPFIMTLSTMLAVSGVAYMLTSGESAYQIPPSFTRLGRGTILGVPNSVLLLSALYSIAHLVMTRTVWGRYLYAVGGNREAARLSGIRTERILLAAYVASALLSGFGGIIMASQLQSGSPMFGQMYELYVIAAVVVGGTSLSGGRGTMLGTLIGAFIIAVIQNGMNLLQVESYLQKVVLGLVILVAVGIDQRRGPATN